jgi:hypothetical protein
MVAIIKTSYSIHSILNYNENKIKAGIAECIKAGNYPIELEKLNFILKLNRFLKLAQLNENAKRNSVHISLNFDPTEKHSKEKLIEIAETYMDKIGFGKQPYLVYEHQDAGHPHLHIVTNNIQRDGKRIDLHLLGIRKSEPARKEIEELFGLVKAEGRKTKEQYSLQPIISRSIEYGKAESKKAINEVLNKVLKEYRYSSLPELNAVLQLYNIKADRGNVDSRVYKTRGLLYKILDSKGNPIGVPIKASSFYSKPTLKFLEEKFKLNQTRRISDKSRIKNAVNLAFLDKNNLSLNDLKVQLEKEGINIVFRKSETGLLYGITYVDHTTKNVFNGSSLGKEYSAKGILERCGLKITIEEKNNQIYEKIPSTELLIYDLQYQKDTIIIPDLVKVLDMLMRSEYSSDYLTNQLKNKKNKRRKGRRL